MIVPKRKVTQQRQDVEAALGGGGCVGGCSAAGRAAAGCSDIHDCAFKRGERADCLLAHCLAQSVCCNPVHRSRVQFASRHCCVPNLSSSRASRVCASHAALLLGLADCAVLHIPSAKVPSHQSTRCSCVQSHSRTWANTHIHGHTRTHTHTQDAHKTHTTT